MNCRTLFLYGVLAFSFAGLGKAKDFYVSQNTIGNGSGADASDTLSLSWLNSATNWGSGAAQIGPADTVHLVGTFTSAVVLAGNGASQNPVTILFEPGANFTSPCWSGFGAIQFDSNSWIVVDGGVNGLIQNTANGTGLTYTNNSRGIGGNNSGSGVCYNSVIENLRITNIYRKIKGNYDATRAGYCIDVGGSGITISNCVVSDGDGGIGYAAIGANSSNAFILNNKMLNCNHTMTIGIQDHNAYMTNLVIAGNYFDHWDVWDDPVGNSPIHLDGIIILNSAYDQSSVMDGTRIYGNTFGGYVGTRTTAAIFTDLGCAIRNYFIYNNLFVCFPPGVWGNGFITTGVGSNVWVVNNTCVSTNLQGTNYGGGIGASGTNTYVYNNCVISGAVTLGAGTAQNVNSSTQPTNSLYVVDTYFAGVWSDHNIFVNSVFQAGLTLSSLTNGNFLWLSGIFGPHLMDWQTWYENEWGNGSLGNTPLVPGLTAFAKLHFDPHGTNIMPSFVPGTYIPQGSDTVAVGQGTNLYWLGITNDFFGNPRSSTGNWTIGAFDPAPGITLTASDLSPTNGENVTLSWTSANATSVTLSQFGAVALNGSTNVVASANTTTYLATAVGPTGTNTAVVVLKLRPQPPTNLRATFVP